MGIYTYDVMLTKLMVFIFFLGGPFVPLNYNVHSSLMVVLLIDPETRYRKDESKTHEIRKIIYPPFR